jgi:quinol monooxygenase YgiN
MDKGRSVIIVRMIIREGKEEDFRKEMLDLIHKSRKEEGNRMYTLSRNTGDNREFFLYEEWDDEPMMLKYEKSGTMKGWGTFLKDHDLLAEF